MGTGVKSIVLVALGGGLGSVARYKLSGWILHHTVQWKFSAGTFIVNVLGCLIAGLLAGLIEKQDFFSPDTRIWLFAGILGGFTTFSAFGLETLFLLRRGDIAIAASTIILSVGCGLLALWLGFAVISHRG